MRLHLVPHPPRGSMATTASKSMAHRMLLCAGLAEGRSIIHGLDYSVDVKATIGALQAMGAGVETRPDGTATITGIGLAPGGLGREKPPKDGNNYTALQDGNPAVAATSTIAPQTDSRASTAGTAQQAGGAGTAATSSACGLMASPPAAMAPLPEGLNCHESGSTLRFLIPLLSLWGAPVRLTGAPRLFQRPLGAYEDIFKAQGLPFAVEPEGVSYAGPLQAGIFHLAGNVSSQFLSGLLFALPLLPGSSRIHITPPLESRSYIELTRSAQQLYGVHSTWEDALTLHVPGGQHYIPADTVVEGDWSNGAVPAVLAAVCGGITVAGLSPESAQGDAVVVRLLEKCSAKLEWLADGNLQVAPPPDGLVSPGEVDLADCPDLGPILCALALFCKGTTRFVNAGRLRIKESDRIESVQAELTKMGGHIWSDETTITVEGGHPLVPNARTLSHNDHRVVMAVCAAAIGGGVPVTIEGAEAINKSWPAFFAGLKSIGQEVHCK